MVERSPRFFGRGFTLIELLVAISILAIVAVLGWRGLDSIVRARVALTADLDQTRGMQLTFAQLQSDAAHIASDSILPNRATLMAEDGRLVLLRNVYADNQPSRLQVVAYRVQDGLLTRYESPATRNLGEIETAWTAAGGDATLSQAVTLQSNVSTIVMRVWSSDGNGWRNGVVAAAQSTQPAPPVQQAQPIVPGGMANPVTLTGLEVSIQLIGRSQPIQKIFFLGAL